jgi:hypothetical protein
MFYGFTEVREVESPFSQHSYTVNCHPALYLDSQPSRTSRATNKKDRGRDQR